MQKLSALKNYSRRTRARKLKSPSIRLTQGLSLDDRALMSSSLYAPLSGGYAARHRCVLKYNETIAAGAGSTIRRQIWRANSLFDPNYSGTGSQPYNFDDLSVMYNRYVVRACTIRVRCMTNGTIAQDWGMYLCPSNAVTSIAPEDMLASPGGRAKMLPFNPTGQATELVCEATTADVLGNTSAADRFQSQISTNPTDGWFWHFVISPLDGIATGFSGYFTTELIFDCEFFDRNSTTLDLLERKVQVAQKRVKDYKLKLEREEQKEEGGYELPALPQRSMSQFRTEPKTPLGKK